MCRVVVRDHVLVNKSLVRSATSDFNKDDDHFTVYVESQGPHAMRERLAASLGVEEKLLQLRKQEKEEKLLNYQDHIQTNTQQLLQILRNMIHLGGLTMKPLKV